MEAMFFGQEDAVLYGVYHPSQIPLSNKGIVIIGPFGQEYMRSHRAIRLLAASLAKHGFHVLRYDHPGQGDSYGELHTMTFKDWIEAANSAINELCDVANVSDITLIGLRLGALVTLAIAEKPNQPTLKEIVLWDPVVKGCDYITEIKDYIERSDKSSCNYIDTNKSIHIEGYEMSAEYQSSLLRLKDICTAKCRCKISHFSCPETQLENAEMKELQLKCTDYRYQKINDRGDWDNADDYGGILLPSEMIHRITHSLVN